MVQNSGKLPEAEFDLTVASSPVREGLRMRLIWQWLSNVFRWNVKYHPTFNASIVRILTHKDITALDSVQKFACKISTKCSTCEYQKLLETCTVPSLADCRTKLKFCNLCNILHGHSYFPQDVYLTTTSLGPTIWFLVSPLHRPVHLFPILCGTLSFYFTHVVLVLIFHISIFILWIPCILQELLHTKNSVTVINTKVCMCMIWTRKRKKITINNTCL